MLVATRAGEECYCLVNAAWLALQQNLLHHFHARERVEGVGQVYLEGDNAFVAMHTCAHCMAQRLAAAADAHPQLKGSECSAYR